MSQLSASDVWPLPKEMEASDVFNGLHRIQKPLLLMHGEKDDICQLSQSQVVFHMLEKQRVPTGLVVYPGEGHGFDEPAHRQDRDRRMLAWWAEHLQGSRGAVPEAFHGEL
uniref:Peptidase S9 prolyl oligopeptidase catalytic domain-containing protein n=1 Tax=Alexandrium catenella TaxID=2925 RepID=A0A7S1RB44_ALECA